MLSLAQQTQAPMIAVGVAMTIAVSIGTLVALFMVAVAFRRSERIVRLAPDDFVAKITVRRTIRNESVYLLIQVLLLVSSAWSIAAVAPYTPPAAVSFYYGGAIIRMVISFAVTFCTIFDMLDRRRIHDEMNVLNAKHLQDYAARLGIDVNVPMDPPMPKSMQL